MDNKKDIDIENKDNDCFVLQGEEVNNMIKVKKEGYSGLTKEKKALLKKSIGKCSCKIDLNKVKDEWKNASN